MKRFLGYAYLFLLAVRYGRLKTIIHWRMVITAIAAIVLWRWGWYDAAFYTLCIGVILSAFGFRIKVSGLFRAASQMTDDEIDQYIDNA